MVNILIIVTKFVLVIISVFTIIDLFFNLINKRLKTDSNPKLRPSPKLWTILSILIYIKKNNIIE